jgi:hypothetical protein
MYRTQRQFFKGCICCPDTESRGAVHDASLKLSTGSTSSKGFRDLELRATLSSEVYNLAVNTEDETVVVGQMKFDGIQYRVDELEQRIEYLFDARKRKYEKWR